MIRTFLFIILFIPAFSFGQKLTLSGNISGLADGAKVVLMDLNNPAAPLDETKSKSGAFTLSSKLDAATLLGLMVGDKIKITIFLGNETVKVTGSVTEKPESWKFTGSKTQDDFTEFQKTFIPKFGELNSLAQQTQMDAGEGIKDALYSKIDDIQIAVDSFIAIRPSSPISVLAILSTFNLSEDLTLLEKRTNSLNPELLNTALGNELKQIIEDAKFNAVGTVALDFLQADTLGKDVSLLHFRGKYVLVDFWASWCGPCRQENHNLVKTYNKFKNKNFTVLGVSLDEDRKKWMAAIKKDELKWTHVSDLKGWANEVAVKYRITSIPKNLLLGPDGKIIAKDLRGDGLDAKLEEIFGN